MFYKMFKIHCKDVTILYTIKYQCTSYVIAPFRDDIIYSNLPIVCSKSKKSFLVWMPFYLHVENLFFNFFFLMSLIIYQLQTKEYMTLVVFGYLILSVAFYNFIVPFSP